MGLVVSIEIRGCVSALLRCLVFVQGFLLVCCGCGCLVECIGRGVAGDGFLPPYLSIMKQSLFIDLTLVLRMG